MSQTILLSDNELLRKELIRTSRRIAKELELHKRDFASDSEYIREMAYKGFHFSLAFILSDLEKRLSK